MALVCSGIYVVTDQHLKSRQEQTLDQYQKVVEHIWAEHEKPSRADLNHKLDDLFNNRSDIALALFQRDVQLYSQGEVLPRDAVRRSFSMDRDANTEHGYRAVLTLSRAADRTLLEHLALTLFGAALAGALLTSWLGAVVVRRELSPVSLLAAQLIALNASRLDHPIDGSGQPSELQPLVAQFNALLSRIRDAYERMKGFNADVAHELRTPLATMSARAELALRGDVSKHELVDALSSTSEEVDRMSRIVGDMLFLAQADRGVVARRVKVASLASHARSLADYYQDALEEPQPRIVVVGDATGMFDVSLLQRALANLLENAIRHSSPNTTITIRLEQSDNSTSIVVENTGASLSPELIERMFTRFHRGDENAYENRHGLGLAIVAAIAMMHDGHTMVASENGVNRVGMTIPLQRPVPDLHT